MKKYKKKCIIDLLYYKTPEVDLEIDVTVVINPHYEEGVKQMKTNQPN